MKDWEGVKDVHWNGAKRGKRPGPDRWGNTAIRSSTLWLKDKLADREWHDYDQLTEELARTDLPLPRYKRRNTDTYGQDRISAAKQAILHLTRRQGYDQEPKDGSRRIGRVRQSPDRNPGGTLKTCVRCGKSGLSVEQRVRSARTLATPVGNYPSGKGDVVVARISSEILCIPCAEHELAVKGVKWKGSAMPKWLINELSDKTAIDSHATNSSEA